MWYGLWGVFDRLSRKPRNLNTLSSSCGGDSLRLGALMVIGLSLLLLPGPRCVPRGLPFHTQPANDQ